MKKILCITLSLFLLMSVFCVIPASAFSKENIEIITDINKITVKVTAPFDGAMTAQVVNATNDELYGMDEISIPDVDGESYVYTFNFKMQYNVPTDIYKVVVGGNVLQTEKEFSYANINDKVIFYTTLDTLASDDIRQFFEDNRTSVPVDMTDYDGLSPEVLKLVNDKIADMPLNPEVLPSDTDTQKNEKVSQKDRLFQSEFSSYMEIALVADADEEKLNECINDGLFDDCFYKASNIGEAVVLPSEVVSEYKENVAKVTSLELSNFVKAFNDATILTIEKTRGFGVLKIAFLYYEENSMFVPTPDMVNIDALVSAGKDTELWKDLIFLENQDVETLVANAASIARSMIDEGVLSQNPIQPGAGIGGGGGGGAAISKPTTPGASIGIVDEKPESEKKVTFTDLSEAEWAREAVENLASCGAINGKDAVTFAPNEFMTREEFVKVLIGAFDLLNDSAKCDFSDVSDNRWSYAYVASANRIGLVTGDGEKFNPTSTILRQDMAVIIYRLFEIADVKISGKMLSFTDKSEISDYAQDAVEILSGAGIINGMGDGTFSPKTTVTRAQAAKVIYELRCIIGGEN